jgi:phosphohistidine swiveling domain-containing protein
MSASWLKTLDEVEGGDLPLVGGKAFNLANLRRHGLPVPPGLVVTTAFFEAQLRHHQLIPLWAGSPNVVVTGEALSWLADALKSSPLARELMAALQARMSETFADVDSFAVRSSGIDEDTRQHAFSGIHLTELGVPREMIQVSIGRCWASALSKEALEYRRQHGIAIQSIRLAVLIQPFIPARVAGVAFTADPVSGASDEIVVEAASGHGKQVVAGHITPARYRLTKRAPDYPVQEATPAHVAAASSGSEKPRGISPSATASRDPLSTSQLRALGKFLEQIEALMAAPQDVEWAIAEPTPDDEEPILFLQTRPITVPPVRPTSVDVEWSRADFRRFLPDLPSPLCASILQRSQDQGLSFFNRLGFDTGQAGAYLKTIYGRPYLNLSLARRLLAQSGLNPAGRLWILGHSEPLRGQSLSLAIDWHHMWTARRAVGRLLIYSFRIPARLGRFESLVHQVRQSLLSTDWSDPSPADLLIRFRLRTRLSSRMSEVDFLITAATVAAFSLSAPLLGADSDTVQQLVRESIDADTKRKDIRQGQLLLDLARIARADKRADAYLCERQAGFGDYRKALAGTPFLTAFDHFMDEYGGSATFEADPGWPRYVEDPSPLLVTIAEMARLEVAPGQSERHRAKQSVGDEGRPGELSGGPRSTPELAKMRLWRRWLARLLIARWRQLAKKRAQLRTLFNQSMSDCRAWDLKLAERWIAHGWLTEAEDYFWLTMEEIERALMAEAEVGPTLSALVRARRDTYQTYAETEMPYTMHESDVARLVPGRGLTGTALSSVLSGVPLSPGQVQGRVTVLHRPDEAAHMQEGAILVTPSTDIAWFPIFSHARGLIVETGGLLSHGSIIAREFGVPAVANIPEATTRFHDGDLVLLDGSTGLVQILAPPTTNVP